jgi:hypothetical protein
MIRIPTIASVLIVIGLVSATPVMAAPSSEQVNACLQMIRDMVGAEPSPTVTKLCKKGDRDGAMKAAMAGE